MALTDRELLELAAKAAGIDVARSRLDDPIHRDVLVLDSFRNPHQAAGPWNPLTDDGDALRMAVQLGLPISSERANGCTWICRGDIQINEAHSGDEYAATRRAIVRAAAEIGKAMP